MKTVGFVRMALLSAGLVLVEATTSAQVVTTLAGSGQVGSGDGNGAQASFAGPLGVAVDLSGDVYVADTGTLKIRKITPSGLVTTVAGDGSPGYDDGTRARFWGPLGVAADVSGNVWVADSDDGFDGAYIKKITPDGVVHNLVLYPGYDPLAVALDKSGNLCVLDHYSGLWKVAADGRSASLVSLIRGWGVAVDGDGNAYVADRDNHKILKVTPAGTVTTLAGSGNTGSEDGTGAAASFRGPTGLAVDSSGTVYVADRGNQTIRKITPAGIVTTLAGSGKPGSTEGTGTAASFNSPASVALDSSGNLYVADSGNNRIRKIAFAGVISGVNSWFRLGLDGKGIGTVVVDPRDRLQVYAAGGYDGDLPGLRKSSDGGRSWADVSSGLPGPIVFSLAADEKRPGTLYAVNGQNFRYNNGKPLFPFGIYKSEDTAASWAPVGENGVSVAAPQSSSGRVYAGGSGGVLSSDDAGKTWRRSGVPPLVPQIFAELSIVTLAVAGSDPSRIYAGVDADMDYPDTVAIYRSDDAGATWKFRVDGLPPLSAFSFAVDPLDPDRVLVATNKGVYSSANGGNTWGKTLSAHARALAADPTDPAVVYAGTLDGVYLSRDHGLTWTPLNSGLSDTRVLSLAIDRTGRHLYAGTRSGLFGIDIAIGPIDVAATPDGGTGYLVVTSIANRIVLGTVDASGTRHERAYGPYEGWAPAALANGRDGLTRVLWTNSDGRSVVWLAGADGVLGSFVLGAESGRTAADVTGGPDGQSRVLSTGPSGSSLRSIDAWGNSIGLVELGSYPGWTASAISDGPDGLTRLLWNNSDGRTGISRVSLAGIMATERYAAVEGWTSVDAAAGADGRTRVLRTADNGQVALWIIGDSGTVTSGPIYDAPPGLAPRRLSTAPDGTSRVLLTDSGSAAVVWILSPEGVLEASLALD